MANIFDQINEAKKNKNFNSADGGGITNAVSATKAVSTDETLADNVSSEGLTEETQPASPKDDSEVEGVTAPPSSLAALGARPVSSVNDSTGGIKPNFSPATKTVGDNNLLKDVELPEAPPPDATPSDITQYYLAKLNAVTGHITAGRSVLAELHGHLKENPDTKALLLPEHLGEITRVMGNLTKRAHGSAQVRKAVSQKRTEKKEVKAKVTDEVADDLGDIF